MAMTAAVKDELSRLAVTKPCCRKAEVASLLRFAGSLHIVAGPDRRSRRSSTPARRPAGCARTSRRSTATAPSWSCSRPAACAGAAATSCGWSRTARRWPGRPVWSTAGAARSAACRRRSSPGRCCDARRPGAARSSPTARSPSPAAPRRWRSPARAWRPRSRWSAPPAGSGIPGASTARCAAWTGSWCATATRSARCSPGSARTSRCWPGRSGGCAARCAPPPTGWPTSTTPTCAARARAAVAAGRAGRPRAGDPRRGGARAPGHRRPAAPGAQQASLEELGALADPPLTKDAIAGRIRRLLALADRRAFELGVDGTDVPASVSAYGPPSVSPNHDGGVVRFGVPAQAGAGPAPSAGQTSDDLPAGTDSAIVSQVGPGALSSPGSR